MLNPKVFENSRPDGIGVLEIVNGAERPHNWPRQFVPLKRSELFGEVIGPLAALRLTQIYGYSRAQCDKVLEAVYRFPLPGDAAVTSVQVTFGNVEIQAELKERQQAEKDYDEAKRQGRQAALATRESPDVFTLQVAGIQPDQDIRVVTYYTQLARSEGLGWSLRIPLTTAPRYARSDELTARHAQGQPLLVMRDPGHRFRLDVTIAGTAVVQSPTHQLEVTPAADSARVQLRDGEVTPDRDCVLCWRPPQESDRPTLKVWLQDDQAAAQLYFLAMVAPPATRTTGRAAREVVLLVDHSGSMAGAKWEAADWAVKRFLSGLTDLDTFGLGLFHSKTRWFAKQPCQADAKSIEEAVRFLEKHKDSGGTELGVALEQALCLPQTPGDRARCVLIVTDAQVTDAGRILRLADEQSARPGRRRINLLCIDAAPNSFLASELAERGGGVAKFLTSDPEEEDITTALNEVLADWAEPALPNLRLEVDRPDAQAAGRHTAPGSSAGWSAIDLGDLTAGRAVWVAGRVPRGQLPDVLFRMDASRDWEAVTTRLDLKKTINWHPALKALFGARRIRGLEFLIHSGYAGQDLRDQLQRLGYESAQVLAQSASAPAKVYAENARQEAHEALRTLLVREALDYGLACSETAFVAMRKESGKLIEGTVAVANALPTGWSSDFLGAGAMLKDVSQVMLMEMEPSAVMAAAPAPMTPAHHLFRAKDSLKQIVFRMMDSSAGDIEEEADTEHSRQPQSVLFSGVPAFVGGEAILFDSARDQGIARLPERATICRLIVRFPDSAPKPEDLDPDLMLLLFVDDLAAPRAKARLADLARQGCSRPLNLLKQAGQVVRLVLVDGVGAWASGAPRIEVALAWQQTA